MSSPEFKAPDYTVQDAATYKANIDASIAANGADVVNIGFSYSGGTFTVHDAKGTALSTTNPGFVKIQDKSSPGQFTYVSVEANQSFIDDAGSSEILNNLFGFATGVAVTSDITFYIYAVINDAGTGLQMMLSRDAYAKSSPAAASIGAPDDAVADSRDDFWSFDSLDETLYDSNPCTKIGTISMRMSSSDDWTVQALTVGNDGIGHVRKETEEWEFVSTIDVASAATVDLTIPQGYDDFKVVFQNVLPSLDGRFPRFRFSTDGGSSFLSTGYSFALASNGVSATDYDAQGATSISLGDEGGGYQQGNASTEGMWGEVQIHSPLDAGTFTLLRWSISYGGASGDPTMLVGVGNHLTAQDTNSVRFYYSSGDVASGTIKVYGRNKVR